MFSWFRKKKPEPSIELTINYPTEPPVWEETKSQKLLKEATAKKKAGDLDGAIETLREAYAVEGEGCGTKELLRLPMYLQEAGRSDEAWGELNELILRRSLGADKSLVMMDCSIIYDKMRLFRQREKKPDLAVRLGVLSYLSWSTGLCMQERMDELEIHISREKLEEAVLKLLKKAKKEDLLGPICDIMEEEAEQLPRTDFGALARRVDEMVL